MLTVYVAPGERTSPLFCEAFARGSGGRVVADGPSVLEDGAAQLRLGDVALFGSPRLWPLLLAARAAGRTWYYGDHGYFQRGHYYRVTRNAFMTDGRGPVPPGAEARLRALGVRVQPWRRSGRHILLCPPGQVHVELMRRAGAQIPGGDDWAAWAMAEVRKYTDRPIVWRRKTDARAAGRPLEADLRDCWAVVTLSSNVAVEAALAGVPVFVLGQAAARAVGEADLARLETPAYPEDRHEFACRLAASQWTLSEMAAGMAWRALNG